MPEYLPYVEPFFDLSTLAERLRHEDSVMLEYPVRDGNWHLARFIVQTRGKNGEAEQVLFAMRLYSEEKRREKDLMSAADAARRANEAKSEFLSRMSHDIRTPMNAIIGLTRLAEEEEDAKKVHSYLHSIETSSNFLLGLINDILDMSKIENGELTLKEDVYHVEEFVEGINTIIRPLMEEKSIRFIVAMNCHESCIRTDKLRFNQISFNLLSNAAKFTPEGGSIAVESARSRRT